jgi:hypothetical protein
VQRIRRARPADPGGATGAARRPAPHDLVKLQRLAGNRAVARAITAPIPVQTARVPHAPIVGPSATAQVEFNTFATWLDGLVMTAYNELDRLQLASWAGANLAQINTFLGGWGIHCATAPPAGAVVPPCPAFLKAWAGTALEAYVCRILMPTNGPPLPYLLQVSHGTTIVDVVATASTGEEAWLDITSVAGHILDKTSWLTRAGTTFVEEIVYPALDVDAMYTAHHAGVAQGRQRRAMIEAARFIRREDDRADAAAKRKIKARWQQATNLVSFAADLGVSQASAKKILYFADIDRYPSGQHPKGAKRDGKRLWKAHQ